MALKQVEQAIADERKDNAKINNRPVFVNMEKETQRQLEIQGAL